MTRGLVFNTPNGETNLVEIPSFEWGNISSQSTGKSGTTYATMAIEKGEVVDVADRAGHVVLFSHCTVSVDGFAMHELAGPAINGDAEKRALITKLCTEDLPPPA